MNKCEETLESDASTKKNVLEEIEQQLSSVSLFRQKIKQAKRHETLS
jgi:predicted peroxiredoxin